MKIASASTGEILHSLYLTDEGTILHCFRSPGGTWQEWRVMDHRKYADVSCSGVGDALHVVAATETGICVHRIREANGSWTEFLMLPYQPLLKS